MIRINEHYQQLQGSYLFAEIAHRVNAFSQQNPDADLIKMGIGDVTRPLYPAVIEALHKAVEDMATEKGFHGYGPEHGYDFLTEKIAKWDYQDHGLDISSDEIFVSDGAKCDVGNFQEILSQDAVIAVTDPVYPVYVDSNVMAGRSGMFDPQMGQYKNIVYLPCTRENGFVPELPEQKVDIIYLCLPNNPTGTTLKKEQLKVWVDYAKETDALILFDAAYEAYISDADVPHSIYEIEGAKDVAIEFRSMSKNAGFTGVRCAFVVVPKGIMGVDQKGEQVSLNAMWTRRQTTKFNGVSYITQKGAAAIYTPEGQAQMKETVGYYMENARTIREGLADIGMEVYGGVNAPYIWLKTPEGMDSWQFFDHLLKTVHIIGTPGAGFGRAGEGYFRLTAFNSQENTLRAMDRFKKLSI